MPLATAPNDNLIAQAADRSKHWPSWSLTLAVPCYFAVLERAPYINLVAIDITACVVIQCLQSIDARAYKPQRGRRRATAIVSCVPNKRERFESSNTLSSSLATIVHTHRHLPRAY